MANQWLNLYKGSPTSGGTDGTAVSTGDNTAPITFTLDATQNEVQSDTLAVRCESGYCTASDCSTTISTASDTNSHWALSLDGTNWSDTVIIDSTVDTVNTCFYVKAGASNNENPQNDTNTKIRVRTKIAAVS